MWVTPNAGHVPCHENHVPGHAGQVPGHAGHVPSHAGHVPGHVRTRAHRARTRVTPRPRFSRPRSHPRSNRRSRPWSNDGHVPCQTMVKSPIKKKNDGHAPGHAGPAAPGSGAASAARAGDRPCGDGSRPQCTEHIGGSLEQRAYIYRRVARARLLETAICRTWSICVKAARAAGCFASRFKAPHSVQYTEHGPFGS